MKTIIKVFGVAILMLAGLTGAAKAAPVTSAQASAVEQSSAAIKVHYHGRRHWGGGHWRWGSHGGGGHWRWGSHGGGGYYHNRYRSHYRWGSYGGGGYYHNRNRSHYRWGSYRRW